MSNTMAEAFCEEHLITWTEHGEDFTDWRDGDIFTSSQPGPDETGRRPHACSSRMEKDACFMIVTVFHDRSWIVQQEPMGGAPPMVGTREDEHRILDLIHQTLEARLKRGQKPEPPEFPAYLDSQGNEHAEF